MRVLLSCDLHANLPAAEAAVQLANELKVDKHIHMGDSIDLGPWPKETLDLLIENKVHLLKGNHEEYATSLGLHPALDQRIGQGEKEHYAWTKSQLTSAQLNLLENLDYSHRLVMGGKNLLLLHYARNEGRISESLIKLQSANLEDNFGSNGCQIVFFGHVHKKIEISQNGVDYRSLMPSGCSTDGTNGKEVLLLSDDGPGLEVQSFLLPWSVEAVHKELDRLGIPDREIIKRIFFNEG